MWDTIAAIATPVGVCGVGILRLSGESALAVMATLFKKPADTFVPRMMYFGRLVHPESGQILDEACGVFFKAPASYTGEDVCELHLHGNPVLLHRVLRVILSLGVRAAEAGEFTRRAFILGKLDLTRAEAVGDLIHAPHELGCEVALNHLDGGLFRVISTLRSRLMRILEQMEGSIDFPEEVDAWDRAALIVELESVYTALDRMIRLQDFGKMIQTGIQCVIVGRPNVGKSSLLNQLVGENRAIVSAIAGTTRDFIDVKVNLGGFLFEFVDTAGIRESQDKIEVLGIRKISAWIKKADWIVWVVDASMPLTEEDRLIFSKLKSKKNVVVVLNKSDKRRRVVFSESMKAKKWPVVETVSRKLGGIDSLKEWLVTHFSTVITDVSTDVMCNARQLSCLKSTHESMAHMIESAKSGFEDAMLVIDLKAAVLKMGELTGDEVTESVLDGVFARFCVGK
jgi:tRNA modification GTPase